MPNNVKKTDTQSVGGIVSNSNRTRPKLTSQKKIQKSAVPNDRGDGEPRKAAPKAKVDTSRPARKQDEVEEIVFAVGQQKQKKPNKRITGRHYQTKQKNERDAKRSQSSPIDGEVPHERKHFEKLSQIRSKDSEQQFKKKRLL